MICIFDDGIHCVYLYVLLEKYFRQNYVLKQKCLFQSVLMRAVEHSMQHLPYLLLGYLKANFKQLWEGEGSFTKPILITTFNTCSTQRSPEASKRVWVSNPENQCQILVLSPEYHLLNPSDKRLDLVWHELTLALCLLFSIIAFRWWIFLGLVF